MPRETEFRMVWLEQTDGNGHLIKNWCKPDVKVSSAGFCTVCCKQVPCANMGIRQIMQHATGAKHRELASLRFSQKQAHFVMLDTDRRKQDSSTNAETSINSKVTFSKAHNDQVTTAEIIWALKVAESNISLSSCDDIGQLFKLMFPGPCSNDFTCGATKVGYLITHGLALYFKENLLSDLKKCETGFTLEYDETTTSQTMKQMDIVVRYWSPEKNRVISSYIESFFFGHAQAVKVVEKIMAAIVEWGVPLKNLISLSSDGPNVNKAITSGINKVLGEAKLPNLVDVGSCCLHKVHNSFGKSISDFGSDAEKLTIELFYWFKRSAARREDFHEVQIDLELNENFLIRHVSCRWLTLQPAIERILQQWLAVTKYFRSLPQNDKKVEKNDKYKVIRTLIDNPRTLLEMKFLSSVSPLFTRFLAQFQQEGPLVHLLNSALCDLYRQLLMRFIRSDCVGNKTGRELMDIDIRSSDNLRPLTEMDIGETTVKTLQSLKQEKHKAILMSMQHFYFTCCESLRSSLPLSNTFLEDLKCLSPEGRSQPESEQSIRRIARKLRQIVNDDEITSVVDEWKMYAIDDIPLAWRVKKIDSTDDEDPSAEPIEKPAPIDDYWAKVLHLTNASGQKKYCTLGKVVRASLSLSHGNADVERSFSINKKVVTPDRVRLGQDTLCALRLVKEAIRINGGGQVSGIVITQRLLQLARSAYSVYKEHLEKQRVAEASKRMLANQARDKRMEDERLKKNAERMDQEKKEAKKKFVQLQKELDVKQTEQNNALKAAEGILVDAEKRLSEAVKAGDMCRVSVASGLLEVGRKRVAEANRELSSIADSRKKMKLSDI